MLPLSRYLVPLLLLASSTLEAQLDLRPMNRDELWRRGVAASRFATNSPNCAENDWVYLETLLYFFAWYQTARPTSSSEANKFHSDFDNKARWAAACLKISQNSSSGSHTGGAARVSAPRQDTASFSVTPPQSDAAQQTDAQGRTIPQLQQLLASREQEFAAVRALRAAGVDGGNACAIQSQSTGLWWAATPGQGLQLRPLGQHTTFAVYTGARGGRVLYTPDQTALINDGQSVLISALSPNNVSDQNKALFEFRFYFNRDGQYHIKHISTNRFLYADGATVALLAPEQSTMNLPAANFTLSC